MKSINSILNLQELFGKTILVTGGTGLIGSAVVDLLCVVKDRFNLKIVVAGRDRQKVLERFRNVEFLYFDAIKDNAFPKENFDYIICGAGIASPELYVRKPVETMEITINGLAEILKKTNAKRVLFVSSSEVYGTKSSIDPYSENEYGYIDELNVRSSYSIAKRAAETYGISYSMEYGKEFVIVRPGHVYGPTASKNDKRVASDFAYKAAEGRDIVLKSTGKQLRSYCYCLDCASAILSVLTSGENLQAYNISNRNSVITIKQMAETLAKAGGVQCRYELPTDIEETAFNPMDNSSLDSSKLEALNWEGKFSAQEGLSHTVEIIRDIINNV